MIGVGTVGRAISSELPQMYIYINMDISLANSLFLHGIAKFQLQGNNKEDDSALLATLFWSLSIKFYVNIQTVPQVNNKHII